MRVPKGHSVPEPKGREDDTHVKGLTGVLCVAAAAGRLAKGIMGKKVPKAKRASFSRYLGRLLKNNYVAFC